MTYKELFSMNNIEFLKWIKSTFPVEIPGRIETMADMEKAATLMLKISAEYETVSEMSSWAKVYCREVKRSCDKEIYEDMVDKKDAIDNKLSALKQAYNGISRAVSVKIENNQELRMTGCRRIA